MFHKPWRTRVGVAAVASLALAQTAIAHPGHDGSTHDAWAAGAMHPLTGLDHLLAMVASGLLAVRIGTRRALWVIPCAFIALMLAGGAVSYAGVPLPQAEWAVSLSVIILGLVVALLPRPQLAMSAGLVGAFAFFHGHAHVAELNGNAVLPYMVGFALATLVLHASAIAIAMATPRLDRQLPVRFAGAAIAVTFACLLVAA